MDATSFVGTCMLIIIFCFWLSLIGTVKAKKIATKQQLKQSEDYNRKFAEVADQFNLCRENFAARARSEGIDLALLLQRWAPVSGKYEDGLIAWQARKYAEAIETMREAVALAKTLSEQPISLAAVLKEIADASRCSKAWSKSRRRK